MSNEIMWWGYLDQNGSLQLKRWFGDHKDYTDDCDGNLFAKEVVFPFAANSRHEAHIMLQRKLGGAPVVDIK